MASIEIDPARNALNRKANPLPCPTELLMFQGDFFLLWARLKNDDVARENPQWENRKPIRVKKIVFLIEIELISKRYFLEESDHTLQFLSERHHLPINRRYLTPRSTFVRLRIQ